MTAIDRYTRLEALGQWRESPEMPTREVVVSFGNDSLVLSDLDENPLCHWAMAATTRLRLDGANALYTPDTEGFETLEIDDAEMAEAIAKVSRATATIKRKTPWFRWVFLVFVIAAISAIFYAIPSIMQSQALRMTGPESARKLGTDMVAALGADICQDPRADIVRELFQSRVFPDGNTLLLIARDQTQAHVFPGGVVVIGGDALQSMQTPNELARLVTALSLQSEATLVRLFENSSPRELFGYITTGRLADERLAKASHSTNGNLELDETAGFISANQPILRDQDWVTLQGICLE